MVWLLFLYFDAREAHARARRTIRSPPARATRVPPEPRLQTTPRAGPAAICARSEDEILNSYGWVDRNAGVVRIPIDEAMKLTLRARAAGATRHRSQTDDEHDVHTQRPLRTQSASRCLALCVSLRAPSCDRASMRR